MATTVSDLVTCSCGRKIEETPDERAGGLRTPCAACGSTARCFRVSITETLEFHGDLSMKHKRPGFKKPIAEGKHGDELTKRTGKWAIRTRVIDRGENRYYERIVEKETGVVIHEIDEPLTSHTGHGSAKKKS
jgi:hypothetical protein